MIVNSKRNGQNIGYPVEPQAIDWLVHMMEMAAPKLSAKDVETIETALRSFTKT